ncbi:hypothetical protein D3Z53_17805 [Lachnospiraceae bacterium]|jgi:hypothetical protein|nr:hypothetical protein [uncultured Schaedlerella sp.]MCI9154729.1 hypothetical protein [Ruminococcus sp.]NBI59861.1 hypothetical protein [Lachnospiraceae bacterium]
MKEILDKTQKRTVNSKKRILRRRFRMIVCLAVLMASSILGYLQFGRDVEVCSSNPKIFSNGSLEEISIIANKLYIFDQEKFAECLLKRCADNSFREVRFSYDLSGYPKEMHITVYMNWTAWRWKRAAFEICYSSPEDDQYNMVENPEMFKIEIQ